MSSNGLEWRLVGLLEAADDTLVSLLNRMPNRHRNLGDVSLLQRNLHDLLRVWEDRLESEEA